MDFGCDRCWPSDDATAAWKAAQSLAIDFVLADEPHYMVSVRRCRDCSQSFLRISAEQVDWECGDDPMGRVLVPLTSVEVVALRQEFDGPALAQIGGDRRSLQFIWSAGGAAKEFWDIGIPQLPHS